MMAAYVLSSHGIDRSEERRPTGSPLLVLVKDIADKLAASWAWYQDYRRTERELDLLTERELNDIGISRWDIPSIAMQSANAKNDR